MRTRANEPLDAEDENFRQTLARFGEPRQIAAPPDLVVRTARRLPHAPPAVVYRRVFLRRFAVLCLGMLVLMGALLLLWLAWSGGPAVPLLGNGNSVIGRSVLTIQLLLKPVSGAISRLVPWTILGLVTVCMAMLVMRQSQATVYRVGKGA